MIVGQCVPVGSGYPPVPDNQEVSKMSNPAVSAEALLREALAKYDRSPLWGDPPTGDRAKAIDAVIKAARAALQAAAPSSAAEPTHDQLIASGLHECASDCQQREDL